MNKNFLAGIVGIFICGGLHAAEHGTEKEAEDLVAKTIAQMKAEGQDKVLAQINSRAAGTELKDLFVFVYDYGGTMLAMGPNKKMVGKNLIDMKDVDGTPLAKGMIDMVKAKGKGWYGPYKFSNPQTSSYEYKKAYCQQAVGETLACVGVYLGDKRPK
ncbi:cache domain-containing protein [Pseudoduganella aquatica]|uniref:Histidine kinase n=1 Tax=Pseudoduganella aquatica TaxID=2660641 RepID=A0A7X4HB40_9BURK|nr:cache domain-containing protein [Pseudoduganella aquatica]MYN07905.1 histidine kinase [Pseudoduganella aquatica]